VLKRVNSSMSIGFYYILFALLAMYTAWECTCLNEGRQLECLRAVGVLLIVTIVLISFGVLRWWKRREASGTYTTDLSGTAQGGKPFL